MYIYIYMCVYNCIYIYIHLAAILGSRLIFTPSTHWLKIVGFTTALIPASVAHGVCTVNIRNPEYLCPAGSI